jgi:hypothetical protein
MMIENPTGPGKDGQLLSPQLVVIYIGVQPVEQEGGAALSFVEKQARQAAGSSCDVGVTLLGSLKGSRIDATPPQN